jgi:hypothetical protein
MQGGGKMYLAKFDANGNRITSIVEGIHFSTNDEKQKYTSDGFVEISDEDQELYAKNDYIRGTDGKPQKKPDYITTDDEKLSAIRAKRDGLLVASDWTQFADSPLTDEKKKEWQTYRQALRDMPEKGCTDLDNPCWPIIPKV